MTELMALWHDRSRASADVKRIALEHVKLLEQKVKELQEMSQALTHLAANCHGDHRPDCPIIADLAGDHCHDDHNHATSLAKVLKNCAELLCIKDIADRGFKGKLSCIG